MEKIISQALDFIIKTDKPVLVIAGPTATGKSSIAIDLAKAVKGYIINGDSRQVYKELVIGSAQPTAERISHDNELGLDKWLIKDVPHFLYGYTSISKPLNLYDYKTKVVELIAKMRSSHPEMTPIIVGGTGLYIDSVIFDYKIENSQGTSAKSNDLRTTLMKLTVEELQQKLGENLQLLNGSDKQNKHRLIRLIERKGETLTKGTPMNYLYFVIDLQIAEIETNIKLRTKQMIDQGLVEENIRLRENSDFVNSIKTIGYREFDDYLTENSDLDSTIKLIELHTRQYAKRQLTWFKRHFGKSNFVFASTLSENSN